MSGRKATPTALRRARGNPGKRAWNHAEPIPPGTLPGCPRHLGAVARTEWKRLAATLWRMGVLTVVDRAALAAYCQCYGRWVEAERKLAETPLLIRTPGGHVQQSPWLSIANRQLELMGRFMAELGLTPAARSRIAVDTAEEDAQVSRIEFVIVSQDAAGNLIERPIYDGAAPALLDHDPSGTSSGAPPAVPPLRITRHVPKGPESPEPEAPAPSASRP